MSDLDFMETELASWRKLEKALNDTCNEVYFRAAQNNAGMILDLTLTNTSGDDFERLREAFMETFEFSLNDVEAMQQYAAQQVRTISKDMLEKVASIIIPEVQHEA